MSAKVIPILLLRGLQLFFILPLCACSKRVFVYYWDKYYVRPLSPNLFNLCVQWLLYVGRRLGMSYERINIVIFCLVWPAITILSIAFNVFLLVSWCMTE